MAPTDGLAPGVTGSRHRHREFVLTARDPAWVKIMSGNFIKD